LKIEKQGLFDPERFFDRDHDRDENYYNKASEYFLTTMQYKKLRVLFYRL